MKWINSTAASVQKGNIRNPSHTTINYIDGEHCIGSIVIGPGRISWHAIGSNGTANTVGQAKVAVEKLAGKG